MLQYDSLILGTPSYGIGDLPGKETGVKDGSWAEFIPQLENKDLSGKRIALYGLGDQDKYKDRFANSLFTLYDFLVKRGAEIIGQWPVDGYEFEDSNSVIDGRFIGLVIDQLNQGLLSDDRIKNWLELITPALVEHISTKQEQIA
jgi:flavodoxin I